MYMYMYTIHVHGTRTYEVQLYMHKRNRRKHRHSCIRLISQRYPHLCITTYAWRSHSLTLLSHLLSTHI